MPDAEVLLDAEGPAAPPRINGELAFDAPWERRLFGMTMALSQRVFSYADFRERLMVRVGEAPTRPYWRSWAAALEDALANTCALEPGVVEARHQEFLARPHGHDHTLKRNSTTSPSAIT